MLLAGLVPSLPAGRQGYLGRAPTVWSVVGETAAFSVKQRPFWCVWEALGKQSFSARKIEAFLEPGGG